MISGNAPRPPRCRKPSSATGSARRSAAMAGGLAKVRTDDLGAIPIRALMRRHPKIAWSRARRGLFRLRQPGRRGQPQRRAHGAAARGPAGLDAGHHHQPAVRVGPERGRAWPRTIRAGEIDLAIAGGVESMTRAPLVMGKAQEAFQRSAQVEDTTIGWRFINPLMKQQYGVDAMPETAENVAEDYQVARKDQDAFALRSQQRAAKAQGAGFSAENQAGRRAGPARPGRSRSTGRAPAARDHAGGPPSSSRSCAIPARSRRAMRPASTTAPPP